MGTPSVVWLIQEPSSPFSPQHYLTVKLVHISPYSSNIKPSVISNICGTYTFLCLHYIFILSNVFSFLFARMEDQFSALHTSPDM